MKRMIRANADNKVPFHNRKYDINIKVVDEKHGFFRGQIIKIAPYDDAEYVWAKIESNGLVKFIKDGKVIDRMQLNTYEYVDPDDYRMLYDSVDEYIDICVDSVIDELDAMNRNIKPIMVHN